MIKIIFKRLLDRKVALRLRNEMALLTNRWRMLVFFFFCIVYFSHACRLPANENLNSLSFFKSQKNLNLKFNMVVSSLDKKLFTLSS